MSRKGKNYLTLCASGMMLYFALVSILGAHERRQQAIETGEDLRQAVSGGWYILIFVFGFLSAAGFAWYFLSKKNELSWKTVFNQARGQISEICLSLGGGLAALLAASVFIGSLPEFTLAPGFNQQREEPVAVASSQQSSQSEEPEPEPEAPANPIEDAKALQTVSDALTVNQDLQCGDPDTSILFAKSGSSLTIEKCTLTKAGDSADIEKTLAYGFNAGLLAGPGATVNVLGANLQSQSIGAPAAAVSGESASVSLADSNSNTLAAGSPDLLAVLGGQARITGGSFSTAGSGSPAFLCAPGSYIQTDGSMVQTIGDDSPIFEASGIVTASGINANSTLSSLAYLHPGAAVSINSSSLSGGGMLAGKGLCGQFVLSADEADFDNPAVLNLENNTWSANPTAADGAPSFYIRNAALQLNMRSNNMPHLDTILRAENSQVTMTAAGQTISGNLTADANSTLTVSLTEGTVLYGGINIDQQCPSVVLNIDAASSVSLFSDIYLTEYNNANAAQTNIYTNGYHIYVNGQQVL